jgi:hypothetical protein
MVVESRGPELASAVRDIKAAIQEVQNQIKEEGYTIAGLDLELKTVVKQTAGAELKVEVFSVGVSGSIQQSEVKTISLSLVPAPPQRPKGALMGTRDELASAIAAIAAAVREAAASEPPFALDEASVSLAFAFTKEGKLAMIAGIAGSHETAHSMKLVLKGNPPQPPLQPASDSAA